MLTRKLYIFVGVLFLFCSITTAQELKLTGKILDSDSNQPLPFAGLLIENSNYTSTTNDKGIFYFVTKKDLEFPIYIQASYLGYEKQRIKITRSDNEITIYMRPVGVALTEVNVLAKHIFMSSKDDISTNTMSSNQVHGLSGLTRDAFRSIQFLPGVSSNNETSAKYNVRGGNYDENLVLINGIEINNPFHIKEAPMASVGIFNIDMVKSINFSAGGFNAEYGNALSSLLNINYGSGDPNGFIGKFDINFLETSILANGPIGEKAGYNIGIRRTNLDYLLRSAKVKPEIDLKYYDYQAQFDVHFNHENKLKLNLIYSGDDYDQKPDVEIFSGNYYRLLNGKTDLVSSTFYRKHPFVATYRNLFVSLISENQFSENFFSKLSFSSYNEIENENILYDDETIYRFSNNPQFSEKITAKGNLTGNLWTNTFSLKQDLHYSITPYFSLKSGWNYKIVRFDYDAKNSVEKISYSNIAKYPNVDVKVLPADPLLNDSLFANINSHRFEGYLQGAFQFFNKFNLNLGMRMDYYDVNQQTKFSPRINFMYAGPLGINFRAAWGVFYQPPSFMQLRMYEPSSDNTDYQKATHYIFGADKSISENITFGAEVYYKKYEDFIPAIKAHNGRISYGEKLNNAIGFARGIDLQLMINYNDFYFWASYGYLVAREKIINSKEGYYPRFSDQTHTLSAVIGVDLGGSWAISLKGFYGSGYAYTPSQLIWDAKMNALKWINSEKNSAHYPAYERVDLSISKGFELFSNQLEVYMDIMNLLNKKNVLSLEYSFDSAGNSVIKQNKLFTVVPMMGLRYSF